MIAMPQMIPLKVRKIGEGLSEGQQHLYIQSHGACKPVLGQRKQAGAGDFSPRGQAKTVNLCASSP